VSRKERSSLIYSILCVGKSSLGNLLYGAQVFRTTFENTSSAMECLLKEQQFGQKLIKVIDTDDFVATPTQNQTEIERSLVYSYPDPHAVLIIFQMVSRLSSEECTSVHKTKHFFDPTSIRYCILIFIHCQILTENHLTFEKYLWSLSDDYLKDILLLQFGSDRTNIKTFINTWLTNRINQDAMGIFHLEKPRNTLTADEPEIVNKLIKYLDHRSNRNTGTIFTETPDVIDDVIIDTSDFQQIEEDITGIRVRKFSDECF
jgi:hypothetical protein